MPERNSSLSSDIVDRSQGRQAPVIDVDAYLRPLWIVPWPYRRPGRPLTGLGDPGCSSSSRERVSIDSAEPVGGWSAVVPVLVVTGPVGVGKSAVLHAADAILVTSGGRHATVELEDIARVWPHPRTERGGAAVVYRNLAAVWSNFAEAGAERLLLAHLIEKRSDIAPIKDAIAGATITVVRLHASLPVLEERIRRREADPDGELSAARWWFTHLEKAEIGDHVVHTDDRSARNVASEVLNVAGWLT
jgi:hypothetical protein